MPGPFSSDTPGEAWVWGDFVATLQTNPEMVVVGLHELAGTKPTNLPPLRYPFALSVFYRKDRSPHGPSNRPVIVATLERIDPEAARKQAALNPEMAPFVPQGDQLPVIGLFTAENRFNLSDFAYPMDIEHARSCLFDVVGRFLELSGEPTKIGKISDIYGHPDTGWEARKSKGLGCLVLISAFAAGASLCLALFLLI